MDREIVAAHFEVVREGDRVRLQLVTTNSSGKKTRHRPFVRKVKKGRVQWMPGSQPGDGEIAAMFMFTD